MTGSLFLLGGGLMQLPAIDAAHELGLTVHLADGNDRCPGRASVGFFHHVDLRDRPGLLECARNIPDLVGVFTAGTDFSASVAYVASALALPAITPDVALGATDKGVMRHRLGAAGIAVPRFMIVSASTAATAIPEWDLPAVVKPVDSMGARAVRLVTTRSELVEAVRGATAVSPTATAIVESPISGDEYSLDALVQGGEVSVTGVALRHIYFRPFFIELGHTIPAPVPDAVVAEVKAGFVAAVKALGIDHGAAKGDIFRSEDGTVTVGEIAARLSGGFMSGWTYPLATGVELTRQAIRLACGESVAPSDLEPAVRRVSAERALYSAPGVVAYCDDREARTKCAAVFMHSAPGRTVAPPTSNVEKVANVIGVGTTSSEADRQARTALDSLVVDLENGNAVTDAYLFGEGWKGRYAVYAPTPEVAAVLSGPSSGPGHSDRERSPAPVEVARLIAGVDMIAGLSAAVPAVSIAELLQNAVERGEARIVANGGPEHVAAWRAIVAAGRQGLRYARRLVGEGGLG